MVRKKSNPQVFNKSYYYLLPMFKRTWEELCYINNTYLYKEAKESNIPSLDYTLTITCFCEDPLIEEMPEFLSKEYNKVKEEYVYLLRIPVEFEEDYLCFLLGKYSFFTPEYRKVIYKILGPNYKSNNIYKVIERDERLKKELETSLMVSLDEDAELTSIFNKEKETYKYDNRKI